jgi:hypothetical protein
MAPMGNVPNIARDKMTVGPRHQKNKEKRGLSEQEMKMQILRIN